MVFKLVVIFAGLIAMVVALMKSDKWDNLVVQYVSLLGFGVILLWDWTFELEGGYYDYW